MSSTYRRLQHVRKGEVVKAFGQLCVVVDKVIDRRWTLGGKNIMVETPDGDEIWITNSEYEKLTPKKKKTDFIDEKCAMEIRMVPACKDCLHYAECKAMGHSFIMERKAKK